MKETFLTRKHTTLNLCISSNANRFQYSDLSLEQSEPLKDWYNIGCCDQQDYLFSQMVCKGLPIQNTCSNRLRWLRPDLSSSGLTKTLKWVGDHNSSFITLREIFILFNKDRKKLLLSFEVNEVHLSQTAQIKYAWIIYQSLRLFVSFVRFVWRFSKWRNTRT